MTFMLDFALNCNGTLEIKSTLLLFCSSEKILLAFDCFRNTISYS